MEAIIFHNPERGGKIQVSHGDNCVGLTAGNTAPNYGSVVGLTLAPDEAIDLGLDLILQAKYSLKAGE